MPKPVPLAGGQGKTIPWIEGTQLRLQEEASNLRTLRSHLQLGSTTTRSGNPCGRGDSTGSSYGLRPQLHAKVRIWPRFGGRCERLVVAAFCLLRSDYLPHRGHRRARSMAVDEALNPNFAKNSAAPVLPARSIQVMPGSDPIRSLTSACPMPRRRCCSATTTMDTYPLEIPSVIARAKPTISSSAIATTARCDAEISRTRSSKSPTRWAHPLVTSR